MYFVKGSIIYHGTTFQRLRSSVWSVPPPTPTPTLSGPVQLARWNGFHNTSKFSVLLRLSCFFPLWCLCSSPLPPHAQLSTHTPSPPTALLRCVFVWDLRPRPHCHVNYLFALFLQQPAIHQSVSQLFISRGASPPVIRFGAWEKMDFGERPCRGGRRHQEVAIRPCREPAGL